MDQATNGPETTVAAAKAKQQEGPEDENTNEANAKTENDAATTPKKESESTAKSDEHT